MQATAFTLHYITIPHIWYIIKKTNRNSVQISSVLQLLEIKILYSNRQRKL